MAEGGRTAMPTVSAAFIASTCVITPICRPWWRRRSSAAIAWSRRVGVEQAEPLVDEEHVERAYVPQPHWCGMHRQAERQRATPGTVRRRTTTSFAACAGVGICDFEIESGARAGVERVRRPLQPIST